MLDIADLASTVLSRYWPLLTRTTFSNRSLFDFTSSPYAAAAGEDGPEEGIPRGLLPIEPPEGGLSDIMFIETSTTHAPSAMTEFGVPGATGADVISNAVPGAINAWIPVGITGFSLDAVRNAGSDIDLINSVGNHFVSAFKRLGDFINGVLCGTTVNSLSGAMDATTQYAGLNPAVLTQWAAYENTTGGLLTEAIMEDVWGEVTGGNRRAEKQDLAWGMETHQLKRYRAIGRMISGNAGVQKVVLANGGMLDLGYSGQEYNQRPILDIPDMPTTEVWLMNTRQILIKEIRSLQVVVKPYAGDGELFYASWRGRLMYPNKHQSGKASALTA
jgi:hypothetical protein